MKDIDYMIEVMKMFDEGSELQLSVAGMGEWVSSTHPTWNWAVYDYRIKPEPVAVGKVWVVTVDGTADHLAYYNSICYKLYPADNRTPAVFNKRSEAEEYVDTLKDHGIGCVTYSIKEVSLS